MSRNLSCRLARLVVALFGCGGPMLCAAGAQQIEQSSIHLNAERSVAQTLTGGTPQLQAQMAGGRNAVSVAVADFDRDGYADLVTGYALASGGALTLQRGNPAAVAPTGDGCWRFVSLVSGGKGGIARDTEAQRFRKNKRRSPRWQGPRE